MRRRRGGGTSLLTLTRPAGVGKTRLALAELSQLTLRERAVVHLRYSIGDGRSRTLVEVARELGISRKRVRQLELVALAKLRRAMSASSKTA